jgi:hypothetical protein
MNLLDTPVPHAGIDHTTLTGVKRTRVTPWSSVDTDSLIITGPYPGDQTIGVNQQASIRNVDGPIPVIYKAIPFIGDPASKWINEMQHEQLVFIARNYPEIPHTYIDANRVGGMHLPHLHYLLHEDALSGEVNADPIYVIKEWFLGGALQNYPDTDQAPKNEPERTINLLVHGHMFLANIWGAHIKCGDYLSLVVIEEEITSETRYVTDLTGFAVQRPGIVGKKGIVKYVSRLVPVVHKSRTVIDPKDLVYIKDCQPIIGQQIYVGRVVYNERLVSDLQDAPNRVDTRINDNPCLNMRRLADCTRVLVHMDVSH